MPAIGRMETNPASGNGWSTGQKIAAGLGAAATIGAVGAIGYGAYRSHKYDQEVKANLPENNPFFKAYEARNGKPFKR